MKKRIKNIMRSLSEIIGIYNLSRPETAGIKKGIDEHLSHIRNGIFIEAGANDGFFQSNTYFLEKALGWHGLLIEPIPHLYKKCKKTRKSSTCINCALIPSPPPDTPTNKCHEQEFITIEHRGARSCIPGAWADEDDAVRQQKAKRDGCEIYECRVPARTLSSLLDEYHFTKVDLLSLDVEGYELSALKGLDFSRHCPEFILIEANFFDDVHALLTENNYKILSKLTSNDFLYQKNSLTFNC